MISTILSILHVLVCMETDDTIYSIAHYSLEIRNCLCELYILLRVSTSASAAKIKQSTNLVLVSFGFLFSLGLLAVFFFYSCDLSCSLSSCCF